MVFVKSLDGFFRIQDAIPVENAANHAERLSYICPAEGPAIGISGKDTMRELNDIGLAEGIDAGNVEFLGHESACYVMAAGTNQDPVYIVKIGKNQQNFV